MIGTLQGGCPPRPYGPQGGSLPVCALQDWRGLGLYGSCGGRRQGERSVGRRGLPLHLRGAPVRRVDARPRPFVWDEQRPQPKACIRLRHRQDRVADSHLCIRGAQHLQRPTACLRLHLLVGAARAQPRGEPLARRYGSRDEQMAPPPDLHANHWPLDASDRFPGGLPRLRPRAHHGGGSSTGGQDPRLGACLLLSMGERGVDDCALSGHGVDRVPWSAGAHASDQASRGSMSPSAISTLPSFLATCTYASTSRCRSR